MNRPPVIKNKGRFSFVIDLFSWALPLNYDAYPGGYGWTHRIRILCFVFHYRTEDNPIYSYEDEKIFNDEYEEDTPF
jgi:hypothetical protein